MASCRDVVKSRVLLLLGLLDCLCQKLLLGSVFDASFTCFASLFKDLDPGWKIADCLVELAGLGHAQLFDGILQFFLAVKSSSPLWFGSFDFTTCPLGMVPVWYGHNES